MSGARRVVPAAALAVMISMACADLAAQPKPAPDFGFYRRQVEPIFLRKRDGHTRCIVCHAEANNNFRLVRLPAGASWTEGQSRQNFEMVAKLVNPGDASTSLLTMHPLAPDTVSEVREGTPIRVQGRSGLEDPGAVHQRADLT